MPHALHLAWTLFSWKVASNGKCKVNTVSIIAICYRRRKLRTQALLTDKHNSAPAGIPALLMTRAHNWQLALLEALPSLFLTRALLQDIMKNIYQASKKAAKEYDTTLQAGANIAGFLKVAEAMVAQGL